MTPSMQRRRSAGPSEGYLETLPQRSIKTDNVVVPPMSSSVLVVRHPTPAETESCSAEDNLPSPSQSLLSAETTHGAEYRASSPAKPTLLTLPPEIRCMIYQHVFPISRKQLFSPSLSGQKAYPLGKICRTIRSEALDLLYRFGTWNLKLEHSMFYNGVYSWLQSLDIASVNALRLMHLSVQGAMFARPGTRDAWGYATFAVDLSEKWKFGSRVKLISCRGADPLAAVATAELENIVDKLAAKKAIGQICSCDVQVVLDDFLEFVDQCTKDTSSH